MAHNNYPYTHYPFSLPSVLSIHPNTAASVVSQYCLDEAVSAGDPIDPEALVRAESMAGVVCGMLGKDPQVTADLVDTARNRAVALRAIHSQTQFGYGAIYELRLMREHMNALEARTVNIEIRLSNRERVAAGQPLTWLRKAVPGPGASLVQILRNGPVPPGVDVGNWHVGARPQQAGLPDWSHYLTDVQIDGLITFYNETFGILRADTTELKNAKIVMWLSQYP